LDNDLNHQHK